MVKIIDRRLPILGVETDFKNKKMVLTIGVEVYEMVNFMAYYDMNKHRTSVICEKVKAEVSDDMRAFFYGVVFAWVKGVFEARYQRQINVDTNTWAKDVLNSIYLETKGAETIVIGNVKINSNVAPISFSRNETSERLQEAIDIWTVWFAENLGATFPIPDPTKKIGKNGKAKIPQM
jgi:23S rRNA maturation mini-RNase III